MVISRKLARTLRAVFRRAGDGKSRSRPAIVWLQADGHSLRIQCRCDGFGVEFRNASAERFEAFAVPLSALAEFEGGKDEPVALRQECDVVVAEWTDAGVPQRKQYSCKTPANLTLLDAPQPLVQAGEGEVFVRLTELVSTCADDSTRFALNCIQLRGENGEAAATDGRHLMLVSGFHFPWREDLLMRRSSLFASKDLAAAGPVEVGRTEEHVVLRAGSWTLWLPIEKEGRFPKVESVVPDAKHAPTVVHLSPNDAAFLAKSLPSMPGGAEPHAPVTLHCNGEVVVRAKDEQSPVTELALTSSQVEGQEVFFNSDRRFLQRAAQLGLLDMRLWSAKAAILCSDISRRYIWMPLDAESAIRPDSNAIRIESPHASSTPVVKPPIERKETVVKLDRIEALTPRVSPTEVATTEEPIGDPIREAETLKIQLRDTLGQVSRLIVSLKRQRKQAQLVRATLSSLKQLQQVG